MGKAEVLVRESYSIQERYRIELYVFRVACSRKYPDGIKARFVLLDLCSKKVRLLIDNHAPFGFHLHEGEAMAIRQLLPFKLYNEALDFFWSQVKEIRKNENETVEN